MPDLPFHFQDTRYGCGHACLQMMIEFEMEKHGIQQAFPQQGDLKNEVGAHAGANSGHGFFISPPDALAAAATGVLGRMSITDWNYGIFAVPSAEAAPGATNDCGARLRDVLDFRREPVFALVLNGLHWVLVLGRQDGFFKVRWPRLRGSNENPGMVHDTECTQCQPVPSSTIPEGEFLNYLLLPVLDADAGNWLNHVIMVVPDAPPPSGPGQASTPGRAPAPSPAPAPAPVPANPRVPIPPPTPGEVKEFLKGQCQTFALLFPEHSARLLDEPVIGEPVEVTPVQTQQGVQRGPYYLVPFYPKGQGPADLLGGPARPFLLAQIDIATRRLQLVESAATVTAEPSADYNSPAWTYKAMTAEDLMLALQKASDTTVQALQLTGKLAWGPCMESISPLQPFHVLTAGQKTYYMDSHGKLHRFLTVKPPEELEGDREQRQ